jgi:hypothetical protein
MLTLILSKSFHILITFRKILKAYVKKRDAFFEYEFQTHKLAIIP